MSHNHQHHHGDHPQVGHVAPLSILFAVFLALIVLTYLTVYTAKIDMGQLNIFVAMGIATLKAALVVLFFMHLYWDKPFNMIVFLSTLIFIFIMIFASLTDTTQYYVDMIQGYAPSVHNKQ